MIELRLPDGTNRRAAIVNYGVRVPVGMSLSKNILEMPFQITVPQSTENEIPPIGTEVWLPS
ncbi:hypothetical protein [Paludisphaera rhizosphaerae]|uniref:hypothetical protein n=1 Tax=Paludisphaera rhizosphaerae TaxID=2711216 RepID=UPI001C6E614F|nr:hypothetical protein [Paludisphaera rhizosphaerae]